MFIIEIRQLNRASFLLFRAVEVQRTFEAAATPVKEGANLSEYSNNKRIGLYDINSPLLVDCFYILYQQLLCNPGYNKNSSKEKEMIRIAFLVIHIYKGEGYGKIIIYIRISNRRTSG